MPDSGQRNVFIHPVGAHGQMVRKTHTHSFEAMFARTAKARGKSLRKSLLPGFYLLAGALWMPVVVSQRFANLLRLRLQQLKDDFLGRLTSWDLTA